MALSKIVSRSTGGQLDVILQRRVRPTSSHSPSLRPEHSTVSALVPRQSLSTAIRTSDLAHPQRPSSFVHVHSVLRHAPALSVPPHDPCPALWRCVQVVTSLRELSCYSENKARIVERGGLKVGDGGMARLRASRQRQRQQRSAVHGVSLRPSGCWL
jgi:hypothetical protein